MNPYRWIWMMLRVWRKERNDLIAERTRFQLLPWHDCDVTIEATQDTRAVYTHFSGWLLWQFNWHSLEDTQ